MRARLGVLFAVGVVVGVVVSLPAAGSSSVPNTRVSVATGGGQSNSDSLAPAISGDGRYVAFVSDASNLVAGDTNRVRDVFVNDRQTGETTRVSVGPGGAEANGDSFAPAISGDGRYVVFSSAASNLVPGDSNGVDDVFLRDRVAGTTTRISVGQGGTEANGGSYEPTISTDGSVIAYSSDATNLVSGDANNVRDVFVYDRATDTTALASVASDGTEGDAPSSNPALDADGKLVAFASFADDFAINDDNETSDIFLRDRTASTTTRVSVYNGGFEADGDSFRPSLSADGRFVAYDSDSFDLAWEDLNDVADVFVYDRQLDVVRPMSVDDADTIGDNQSIDASISADGRFVAFATDADNLVPGDKNGTTDVVIHDRVSGATRRISVTNSGDEADGDSLHPSISADGTLVAFDSDSTNLVAGDTNRRTDVFVRDTTANPPPPPQPASCVVPRVIGLRLATARQRIAKAHCKVGRVRHRLAAPRRVGRVLAQSPRAGTRRAAGTKVNLVVGRR